MTNKTNAQGASMQSIVLRPCPSCGSSEDGDVQIMCGYRSFLCYACGFHSLSEADSEHKSFGVDTAKRIAKDVSRGIVFIDARFGGNE